MAMGRRRSERQAPLFVTAENLPESAGHPFYKALNRLLAEAEFDRWIEDRCLRYYDNEQPRGQKSIPPGVYFRMLLVGYFEGIDSQRSPKSSSSCCGSRPTGNCSPAKRWVWIRRRSKQMAR